MPRCGARVHERFRNALVRVLMFSVLSADSNVDVAMRVLYALDKFLPVF
jgi:hypothetical protein